MAPKRRPGRSRRPRDEARLRYVEMGQLAALQQIKRDSEALDRRSLAVGPFARLDAGAVAERDGKTRGVISHLFGSQAAFQAATMARALDAGDWIEQSDLPAPADHPDAGAWVEALFAAESARGPQRGARPKVDYAALWALWLSTVPYGLWSDRVSTPSMEEHVQWVEKLEGAFAEAIEHFGAAAARVRDAHRPRRCGREPDRGRVAQPVPDRDASVASRRAERSVPAPLGPPAVGGGDYGGVVTGGSRSSSSPSMSRCKLPHVAVEVALDRADLRVELGLQLVAELREHVVDAAEDHDGEEDEHDRDAREDAPGPGALARLGGGS